MVAALLLTAVLALGPAPTLVGGGSPSAAAATLNEQLQDTRSRLDEARGNLDEAQAQRKAAIGDLAALDEDIEDSQGELSVATAAYDDAADQLAALQQEIETVTTELTKKRKELARTENDLSIQQGVFNARLVSIYKSGGQALYLVGLLDTDSWSRLLGRIDLLSNIAQQDHDILAEIEALKTVIEEQRTALESQRVRVSALQQEQRMVTETLKVEADKKQAALDKLEAARNAKEAVLAAAEEDVAAWTKQENALSAESKRIEAQIKAIQAAGSVSSSSSSTSAAGSSSGGGGQLYRPVPGAITSPYGYRMHPIFHERRLHTGVDMHAGMGTPIHAAAAGTVVSAGTRGGYGKCIVISHGGNLSTLYAHQSSILVSVGQKVSRGQVIGKVGSTGYSTGPHLHFEVRVSGSPVNPAKYL